MCGINGIAYSNRSGTSVDRDVLIRMRDVQTHRGPDDAGIYIDGRIGLGHRRLSIVDVAHGAQPMTMDGGDLVIVYNGEVYDHMDSRQTLTGLGHEFENRSDTETILHLYKEYGADCVSHLRGMFAFAIWDRREKRLFIARDRFGVKPLYYHVSADGSLFFGSEIKTILAAGGVRPELNYAALPDQLGNHGTSGDETLFAGIKRLLPGHTLIWDESGHITIKKYWDLSYEPKTEITDEKEFVGEWLEMFRRSVELRLMADVPLGMFLSGGIDSTAIAGLMSQMVSDPIKTFSVAFNEAEANELDFAREASRAYGTDHHEIVITPDQFFEVLPRLVWHEDEPIGFVASVPLYFVSKLASEHVKVVLTGEGSDEMLAGYGRYAKAVKLLSMGERYNEMTPGFLRSAIRGGVATLPGKISSKLERTFLSREANISSLFFDNFSVFPRSIQKGLFTPETLSRIPDSDPFSTAENWLESTDAKNILDKLLYADTKTYLHELLMKQDQMSMAASIESRVPFLDHKLAEMTAKMPVNMKLRGATTKWILREAMKDIIPRSILERPKMGFPVPIGQWLRGEYKYIVEDYVLGERAMSRGIFDPSAVKNIVSEHNAGRPHDERLWALINFEIWNRTFIDGEN